ncbi:protein phosphatase 2C domain-containing protein [Streptomyces sp. NBC_00239]|uniref:protein phosphatase 2C domain-containing protein n=1 Tax=Streptomyces sp. NBC_00239 TaxID=2903640 RepID=UPI002E2B4592|nr:protein phosphatase 2C domain-containing protein [Streptomyces sp. NBC_00239]
MARMNRQSGCPSCAEPLEEGDRFCGRCGYSLSAPPSQDDRPTVRLTGPHAGPSGPWGAGAHAPGPDAAGLPGGAPWATGTTPGAGPAPTTGPHAGSAAGPQAGPHAGPGAGPRVSTGAGLPFGAAEPSVRFDGPGYPAPPAAAHEPAPGPAPEPPHAPSPHTPSPQPPSPQPPYEAPYEPPYDHAYDHAYEPAPGTAGPPADPAATAPAGAAPEPAAQPAPAAPGGKTCVACRAGRVDTDGYCEHCGHAQPRERDHQEEELGSVAAVSDRGLRHHRNEDSFAVAATSLPDGSTATVAVVCDGVSSASRPDDASAAAAAAANEALLEALPRGTHPQQAMHEAIVTAGAAVNALAPEVSGHQNAPACTLVGAVAMGGLLVIGWVGDSRAYWVPDDRSTPSARLTEDDSWAAQMVAAGLMGEAEAYADVRAHAITGWLGADAYELEPHTAAFKPDRPGVVVVCTDGLWNYAESAAEMARVLPADAAARPLHSAQVLVGHALDGGGHDNVTVAVLPFPGPPRP